METAAAPVRQRRLATPLGWVLCLVLGLVFGQLCRVPMWGTYLTARVIGQEAGWAYFDATFDEGTGLTVGVAVLLWAVFALVAGSVSWGARRWTRIPARPWWWATALLWLAPFAVLDAPTLP